MFSVGLAKTPVTLSLGSLMRPPNSETVPGLVHGECLAPMELGSPILSPKRMRVRTLCMFAAWESESDIDEFLETNRLGQAISAGWHIRMSFLRRWGSVKELAWLPETVGEPDLAAPVAAFTLARMRLPELPRFVKWGRPVETLVRDHPETSFSMAAIRYPRSIATFSLWTSLQGMLDMVHGHSGVADAGRHIRAMEERDRRDFHHEFTTLRFQPLSEHGTWEGRSTLLPERLPR